MSVVMNSEVWKDITDYEGYYQVSNLGRVRSLNRIIKNGRKYKGKIRKPIPDSKGYMSALLSKDGYRRMFRIHTLVMNTFAGPRPSNMVVCHGRNGKSDNSLSNLQYATESDNHLDQWRDGTMTYARPVKCSNGKQYPSIRHAEIDTGISNQSICHVLKGRNQTAGGFKWEYMDECG